MSCSKLLAAALAFASFTVVGAASAQTKDTGYTYEFYEDGLLGEALGATPPLLEVRRPRPRILLLRPRAHFVGELLESVEAL